MLKSLSIIYGHLEQIACGKLSRDSVGKKRVQAPEDIQCAARMRSALVVPLWCLVSPDRVYCRSDVQGGWFSAQ